jgi:CarD family transcriptional regulator
MASKLPFSKGDYVVYPTHGVGKVLGVERQEVAGFDLQLFVISFAAEKMTLRVPTDKVKESGLRKLSSRDKMQTAMTTLKGRARAKRTMWSRRAQEYEAKINSGDPVAIAEVVRDLHRAAGQPDQSYSERQMYEAALQRLCGELALVEKIDSAAASEKVETFLIKVPAT